MDIIVTEEYRRRAKQDLEIQIEWILDHPSHQFPGWQNVVWAMRKACEVMDAIVLPAEKKGSA